MPLWNAKLFLFSFYESFPRPVSNVTCVNYAPYPGTSESDFVVIRDVMQCQDSRFCTACF
eukprot:2082206-Rhodomonas_salina.1